MSDIGYLLLLRAVLRRAELDAVSKDARMRNDALAFLLEYGIPLCRVLEAYFPSMHNEKERIEKLIASARHDDGFVEATNKMFVRRAIERHGIKRLVTLCEMPREKIIKCNLSDNELRRLVKVVSELDSRLIEHALEIARRAGINVNIEDPWSAVELIRGVTNGALITGGIHGKTNNTMRQMQG